MQVRKAHRRARLEDLARPCPIMTSPAKRKTSFICIPYRRSSPHGPSFATYAPAPTRLTTSNELGLDCEPMLFHCLLWQPANRNALPQWSSLASSRPCLRHRSPSPDGAPEPPAMLAQRNHVSRNCWRCHRGQALPPPTSRRYRAHGMTR